MGWARCSLEPSPQALERPQQWREPRSQAWPSLENSDSDSTVAEEALYRDQSYPTCERDGLLAALVGGGDERGRWDLHRYFGGRCQDVKGMLVLDDSVPVAG